MRIRSQNHLNQQCVCVRVCVSHIVMFDFLRPRGLTPARLLCPWNSPGKNIGVDCHFLLQIYGLHINNHIQRIYQFSSVQFISVAQLCLTLCDPMNRSTPGFPVHHQLPEFTQTHVHRVCDAIQPSHPLSSPSPPAPNPSQHQSLFQ